MDRFICWIIGHRWIKMIDRLDSIEIVPSPGRLGEVRSRIVESHQECRRCRFRPPEET